MIKKIKKFFFYLVLFLVSTVIGNKIIHIIKNRKATREAKKLEKIQKQLRKAIKKSRKSKERFYKKLRKSDKKIEMIKNRYSKKVGPPSKEDWL